MLHRFGPEPLLTRADVPAWPPVAVDVSSVFNPGAVVVDGVTVLLCRVQTRGRRTLTWVATATAGRRFTFRPKPVEFVGLAGAADPVSNRPLQVFHNYDARITACEGRLLVTTALDTDADCRLALWLADGRADDGCGGLSRLRLVSLTGGEDTRNGVLFPRRVGGRYLLLDRPNTARPAGGPPTGDSVRLLSSDDLVRWRSEGPVFAGCPRYWDELVGAGPPPIETGAGWLLLYHGVATHFQSANIYQAGAVLLDRDDPTRVLGRTAANLLEPRLAWEVSGQVPNVIFPSGLTVSGAPTAGLVPDDAIVNVFYGAADTCVGLATARVGDLLAACT